MVTSRQHNTGRLPQPLHNQLHLLLTTATGNLPLYVGNAVRIRRVAALS